MNDDVIWKSDPVRPDTAEAVSPKAIVVSPNTNEDVCKLALKIPFPLS